MSKIPIIVILGPTAIGKTEVAIELALRLNCEIVSADSMQIYRYMDIGTAKPTMEERRGIPHHMIDIIDPDDDFNVSMYQEMASSTIQEILDENRSVILAGGTGLYISSLIQPTMTFTEAGVDPKYRRELAEQSERRGNKWLHNKLLLVDPETGAKLHPNDTRRIIRALEVYHLTGIPMSRHHKKDPDKDPDIEGMYNPILIGLNMERDKLYNRIDKRVDKMIYEGLVEEVKDLMDKGYSADLNSMRGLGYKEIIDYLKGHRTLEEAIYILKRDTRRFAKRQLTWFRRLPHVHWMDMEVYSKSKIYDDFIEYIRGFEGFGD